MPTQDEHGAPLDAEGLGQPLPLPLPLEVVAVDGEHRVAAVAAVTGPERSAPATIAEVLEALRTLRLQHGPDGLAKRHQPLTLLWAIGRAQARRTEASRLIPWPEARMKIGQLIDDFGRSTDDRSPHLPFLALAGSDIWELTAKPPRKGRVGDARRRWLNNTKPIVKGGFTKPVFELFTGSEDAVVQVVDLLLADHFDAAEREGLLAAVGLSDLANAHNSARTRPRARRPGGGGLAGRLVLAGQCLEVILVAAVAAPTARRPGATGHSSITQRRNPASVETGASTSRSAQRSKPPAIASGVVSSSASASLNAHCRATVHARTTPIAVSDASA
jgi:hypothetical protein